MKRHSLFLLFLIGWMLVGWADDSTKLPLYEERQNEFDLKLEFANEVGEMQVRYLIFEDLLTLPTQELTLPLELYGGSMRCRVVMLSDFLKVLPKSMNFDTLFAYCVDGYFSVFPQDFIEAYKPFFVVQIEDKNPVDWIRTESGGWMGPYLILVSEELAPGFKKLTDSVNKLPWGVEVVRFANYDTVFEPINSGKFEALSASAALGRELYVNNCASCHAWEDASFGGNKSNRTFPVVASHAAFNKDYFLKYMQDPKAFMPETTMPAMTHYSDEALNALIDFLKTYYAQP